MQTASATVSAARNFRDPRLILLAGSMIALIAVGTRHSFGLFLNPVTQNLAAIDRQTFGFAIALQNLMWGLAQPFAGMIADRFGSARVIFVGGALYSAGLIWASASSTALGMTLGLGVLVGVGLSATTYAVVLGAVGRRFPPERRATALGIASLGGSIGIFLSVPVTLALIDTYDWSIALISLALVALAICVMAPVLGGRARAEGAEQSLRAALTAALGHRGFMLLALGFFVCGFQLAFIGTHLPAYLLDRQLDVWLGGAALAIIGVTNIVGTLACGALGDRLSKKKVLAALYLTRAAVTAVFVLLPSSTVATLTFAAAIGFTWLGTVPLTSAIVAQLFGPRYLATLVGITFLMHQLGSFLGAWLGGLTFQRTGSYDLVWWSVVVLGIVAALLHWPIDERPLAAGERARSRVPGHG
ncbi:MAG: MFS transporter [Azospirillaceae bacterium]